MTSILDFADNAIEIAQWASNVSTAYLRKGIDGINFATMEFDANARQLLVVVFACFMGTALTLRRMGNSKSKQDDFVKEHGPSEEPVMGMDLNIELVPTYSEDEDDASENTDEVEDTSDTDVSESLPTESVIEEPLEESPPKAKKETLAQMRKRVAKEMKEAEELRRYNLRSRRRTRAAATEKTNNPANQRETRAQMKARVAREFAAKRK